MYLLIVESRLLIFMDINEHCGHLRHYVAFIILVIFILLLYNFSENFLLIISGMFLSFLSVDCLPVATLYNIEIVVIFAFCNLWKFLFLNLMLSTMKDNFLV